MIICGYAGIGKSSIAKLNPTFINLESSNFYMNNIPYDYNSDQKEAPNWDSKPEYWYVYYTNIAIDLHKRGYTVFLSCHPEVRRQLEYRLAEIGEKNVLVIIPSADIEKEWHDRLEDRYLLTNHPKDLRALNHVSNLANVVEDVRSGSLPAVFIRDIKNYNLAKVLLNYAHGMSWKSKHALAMEVEE